MPLDAPTASHLKTQDIGEDVGVLAGKQLDLAEDVFKLGHLLEANILAKREAVEDLASAALKEEAIEAKLAAIAVEWGEQIFTFQDYKSRGPVVLKVCSAHISICSCSIRAGC